MDSSIFNEGEASRENDYFQNEVQSSQKPISEEDSTGDFISDGEPSKETTPLPCEIPIQSIIIPQEFPESSTDDSPFIKKIGLFITVIFCSVSLIFYIFAATHAVNALSFEKIPQMIRNEVFSVFFLNESSSKNTAVNNEEKDTSDKDDATSEETLETYPIKKTNLAVSAKNAFSLNNQTNYTVRPSELIKNGTELPHTAQIYEEYGSDAPAVLIIHTHGTEAYSENCESYDLNEPFRSNDISKNVVAVGKVMADVFKEAGINVIHDTEMYDLKSYRDSYTRSRAAVAKNLENNPSIAYVFDVHRDAIIQNDKTALCPVGLYEGFETAQIMLVAGTDQDGAEHKEWKRNFTLALQIQTELTNTSDELARNINVRTSAFNQGLSDGSLLLEIGSCANTLLQAKRCAVLSALSISEVINGKETELSPLVLLEKYAKE